MVNSSILTDSIVNGQEDFFPKHGQEDFLNSPKFSKIFIWIDWEPWNTMDNVETVIYFQQDGNTWCVHNQKTDFVSIAVII